MFKKHLILLLLATLALVKPLRISADELMNITREAGYEVYENYRPKASIVIDGNSGSVLWEDNADVVRDPASMSKMMTMYLVYEAIEQGQLTEDTVIVATEIDQAISTIHAISNNKVYAGVDYTVGELISMSTIPSSNVATVMLANYLSNNDPDLFLDMMNEKSQELGMTKTKWYNASGASASSFAGYYNPQRYDNSMPNQTTARDLSILVYHFINKYPAVFNHTGAVAKTVKIGTPYEETLYNYNYSLPGLSYGLEGVLGMKTGSSPGAAYNYMANADRNGQKMITIIMGVGDWYDDGSEFYRHAFGNALLEKSYADYEYRKVLSAGEHEFKGKPYIVESDVYATVAKGKNPKVTVTESGEISVENGLKAVGKTVSQSVKAKRIRLTFTEKLEEWFKKNAPNWKQDLFVGITSLGVALAIFAIPYLWRKKKQAAQEEQGE